MCGIFGLADRRGIDVDQTTLDRCRDSLIHRGPDSSGSFRNSTLYLGFRRLAILDLSPEGNQPMQVDDGRLWIVFNGEIYNFLELRGELQAKGYRFRSGSDTEVLLHLYTEYGSSMFAHLNGMFSLALYDRDTNTLLLARDRLGKKPLFYWQTANGMAFSSELAALRFLPGFPRELDSTALGLYARLGWVPNWASIHPGVHKLPPGCWLKWDLQTGELHGPVQYWTLPPVSYCEGSEEQWIQRIEELLWDATRIRLRSDVPLGIFLSGGIDSGLVAAASSKQSSGSVKGMTIGFSEWAESEWPIAQQTARHLGLLSVHSDVRSNATEVLPQAMAHFDEPFSDSSALPTLLVCGAAKDHVTVALSGDGGDELFGGYGNHVRAWMYRYIDFIPDQARRAIGALLMPFTQPDSSTRRLLRRLSHPVGTWGMGAKLYPFEDWIDSCVNPEYRLSVTRTAEVLGKQVQKWAGASSIDQAQRCDLRLYMLDDILVKVDRMSMKQSLEVRSPFLDYRLVELALQIPPALRVKQGRNKYLLRRLAERHLPSAVVQAPKKGFGIPLNQWIFESPASRGFREIVCEDYGQDDLLLAGGGEQLWRQAKSNPALTSAVFRILAYRWWSAGVRFAA